MFAPPTAIYTHGPGLNSLKNPIPPIISYFINKLFSIKINTEDPHNTGPL